MNPQQMICQANISSLEKSLGKQRRSIVTMEALEREPREHYVFSPQMLLAWRERVEKWEKELVQLKESL